jgi:hypothetical protein
MLYEFCCGKKFKRTPGRFFCLFLVPCEDANLELQDPFCGFEATELEKNIDMLRRAEQKDRKKSWHGMGELVTQLAGGQAYLLSASHETLKTWITEVVWSLVLPSCG